MEDLSRTFGSESVSAPERERRIRGVFQAVAQRYDLMNDLMSFGIHIGHIGRPLAEMRRLWKSADARGFDWYDWEALEAFAAELVR